VTVLAMAVTVRMRVLGVRVRVGVFICGAALLLVVMMVVVVGVVGLVVAVLVGVFVFVFVVSVAVIVGVGVLGFVVVVVVLMLPVPCEGRKGGSEQGKPRCDTQTPAFSREARTVVMVVVVRMLFRACVGSEGRELGVEDEAKTRIKIAAPSNQPASHATHVNLQRLRSIYRAACVCVRLTGGIGRCHVCTQARTYRGASCETPPPPCRRAPHDGAWDAW